jgi:tRNA (cmo5U34)-methyltransferase
MGVKDVFDKYARSYDRARRKLVPCFDDFYGIVLGLIPYGPEDEFRVLDLGAGTGLLSLLVSNTFPKASLTLVDLSQDMLARAKERFAEEAGRFDFIVADYAKGALPGEFDVILSALSIHHLPDHEKEALFKRGHSALAKSGVFINADQVRGSTPEIEERYRKAWLDQVRSSGASRGDLEAAFERMREDRMATLETQLRWLRAAGFHTVNCWYKNYSFVVYAGFKGGDLH